MQYKCNISQQMFILLPPALPSIPCHWGFALLWGDFDLPAQLGMWEQLGNVVCDVRHLLGQPSVDNKHISTCEQIMGWIYQIETHRALSTFNPDHYF